MVGVKIPFSCLWYLPPGKQAITLHGEAETAPVHSGSLQSLSIEEHKWSRQATAERRVGVERRLARDWRQDPKSVTAARKEVKGVVRLH